MIASRRPRHPVTTYCERCLLAVGRNRQGVWVDAAGSDNCTELNAHQPAGQN